MEYGLEKSRRLCPGSGTQDICLGAGGGGAVHVNESYELNSEGNGHIFSSDPITAWQRSRVSGTLTALGSGNGSEAWIEHRNTGR